MGPDEYHRRLTGPRQRQAGDPVRPLARLAAGSKRRLADDKVVIDAIVGEIGGRNVIILDDEVATGGSILELMNALRREGAERLALACTHGLFTGKAIERLAALDDLEHIVTTNTVPIPEAKRLEKMTVLSIAPLLAETISRIHHGESVSALFVNSV